MAAAIYMSLLFAFRIEPAVAYLRPVVRLVPPSRVGVPFVSRGLAFSCRRWCLASRSASRPASAFRVVGRLVSVLPCCAVFVSSCSRVVSSVLVADIALFVFVPSCVSDGVGSLRRCGRA